MSPGLSLALALALFAEADAGPAPDATAPEPSRYGHPSMGTVLHCEWAPSDGGPEEGRRAVERALAEVDRVEAALSHFRGDSELSRFNAMPAGLAHRPSPILEAVFAAAEDWRLRSGGAFSCRLQPWLALRGFIPSPPGRPRPLEPIEELTAPRAITTGPGGFAKHRAGAGLDFDGIAKGYALDLAAGRLAGKVGWAFLSYGSSGILVGEGGARTLAIPDPRRSGPDAPVAVAVWFRSGSFSTSSCAENRRGGTCHLVDPRTLRPADGGLLSATVLLPEGTGADALSTALMILSPEQALELALRSGAETVLIAAEPFGGATPWKGLWVYVSEGLRPFAELAP